MTEKIKKYHQLLVIILIVACMGVIMIFGANYVKKLRRNLQDNAIQNVMTVTKQQQQDFDTFTMKEREELLSYAEFFSQKDVTPEDIQQLLTLPSEADAIYLAACLDDGWVCGTSFDDIRQLEEEDLNVYRSLDGSGFREPYTGLYSGTLRFGYYEIFTFKNGHKGLIQKSFDRSKVSESFSLSFYNDQGFAHIINQKGDILLRPDGITGNLYNNIFDLIIENHGQQKDVDRLKEELNAHGAGSMTVSGDAGEFVYTYTPLESMTEWYLVSVVPLDALTEETNQILLDFQMALGLLILFLFICAMFILLVFRTQRHLLAKDKEIEYQEQFFNIFASYLATNTNDVYIMLDHETETLEYVSPNVERVLGVKAENLLDYIWDDDFAASPEATKAYYAELNALTPGQSTKPRNTERVNPKTGERKYFVENAYCTSIQGRTKRISYISDRTTERMAQDSLAEALRMAQAANDAKSAFLGSVSHDIRTPMNAIIGFLALMRDEVDKPDTVMEYNKRIDAASQHLLGLINDVLDMNKIESGSATLNISEMNLAEVIDEINTIIRPQSNNKNQTFDIYVSHLAYEHVLGDKLRINQILINLLSNAVKYTPEHGIIQMRVDELPQVVDNYSRIRFTVSDNGMGMSSDYLQIVFDPFTREDNESKRQIQGTGLGMAITKSLVDLMGGSISVESTQNVGTTFTVELELCIQEKEDDPKFWNDHKITSMIVADDEEEVCLNIVKTMSQTGVVTDYATDGKTAIQMMRSAREAGRPYNLILLDWKMPNLNGLETARLIRKNYPDNIPILLLTAYDWSEIEEEAKEIGVDHFMPKPFFMSTFKQAIQRIMGSIKKKESSQISAVKDKHILVVDDIDPNRLVLVKILTTQGAICDTAANGHEAVKKFEASKPGKYDLILMDVQMPVMDGYTATRMIRSSGHPSAKTIPIIAMTANAFVEDVRNAIDSGMDAHVAKPVQRDILNATIQQVFDSRLEKAGKD
ncbi:MAG: response regulator [Clostridium sp.]|nr:response regulator [Clostridium sp.]